MGEPVFSHDGEAVVWHAGGRRIRLTETEVEQILDIFDRERAPELFNTLHDALLAAGGIERVSSLRSAA